MAVEVACALRRAFARSLVAGNTGKGWRPFAGDYRQREGLAHGWMGGGITGRRNRRR